MPKPNKRLAGQTAIITAKLRHRRSNRNIAGTRRANVVVNYITHSKVAEEVAHKIDKSDLSGKAIATKCNVSKVDQVMAMFK